MKNKIRIDDYVTFFIFAFLHSFLEFTFLLFCLMVPYVFSVYNIFSSVLICFIKVYEKNSEYDVEDKDEDGGSDDDDDDDDDDTTATTTTN